MALSIICAVAYFVLPHVFNRMYYQTYIKQNIKLTSEQPGFIGKTGSVIDSKVNIRDLVFPMSSKVYNTSFMGEYFLTPINTKNREISSLYLTNKLTPLEVKLRKLMKSYPMLKPGIFVWEYDSGKYLGINENEIFSAASIIKIPVLGTIPAGIPIEASVYLSQLKLTNLPYMMKCF